MSAFSGPLGQPADRNKSEQAFKPLMERLEDRAVPAITVGPNVDVTQLGALFGLFAGNEFEIDIAVNPTNPDNIVVAPIDENGINGISTVDGERQDSVWVSRDGGTNWQQVAIPNPTRGSMPGLGGGGDPSLAFTRDGTLVYTHLVNILDDFGGVVVPGVARLVIGGAVSDDGGLTWTNPTEISTTPGFVHDKNWINVGPDVNDLTQDRFYMGYHDFNVNYVQSSVDGVNWTDPVRVQDSNFGGINIQLAVGNAGEVYAVWEDFAIPGITRIRFDMSVDGGQTWGADQTLYVSNVNAFLDPLTGRYTIPPQPTRGISSLGNIDVDHSNGPNRGDIYISLVDQGDLDGLDDSTTMQDPFLPLDHNNTDVFIIKSTDGGQTFTTSDPLNPFADPIRVNSDNSFRAQFQPWVDVDPVTGLVGFIWTDASVGASATSVAVMMNVSTDGLTWDPTTQVQVAEGLSDVTNSFTNIGNDFLEYNNVELFDGVAYIAWADNSNSTGDNPDGAQNGLDAYFARAQLGIFSDFFVLDVSESMQDTANQDVNFDGEINALDDLNNDGVAGSLIDFEIQFVLDRARRGLLSENVSLAIYGRDAKPLDMSADPGLQRFVDPSVDSDGDGMSDLEEILRSITVGKGGIFADTVVDPTRTNYCPAVELINATAAEFPGEIRSVNMLSDGSGRGECDNVGIVPINTILFGPYRTVAPVNEYLDIALASGGATTLFADNPGTPNPDTGFNPVNFPGLFAVTTGPAVSPSAPTPLASIFTQLPPAEQEARLARLLDPNSPANQLVNDTDVVGVRSRPTRDSLAPDGRTFGEIIDSLFSDEEDEEGDV